MIPVSLSSTEFDDVVLRIIMEPMPLTFGDAFKLAVDDFYGAEYSDKIPPYADVILASIARLQDRGLLSKYEGRTVLE